MTECKYRQEVAQDQEPTKTAKDQKYTKDAKTRIKRKINRDNQKDKTQAWTSTTQADSRRWDASTK